MTKPRCYLVIRCPRSREISCKFFIWERDEAEMRVLKTQSPIPRTPEVQRFAPIPNTRDAETLHRSIKIEHDLPRATSPTPTRENGHSVISSTETSGTLGDEVVNLLSSEGVKIKESVRLQLEDVISTRVDTFEQDIRQYKRQIALLQAKLKEAKGVGTLTDAVARLR
jgi:hypothetical protein